MTGFGTYVFAGLGIAWLVLSGVFELGVTLETRMTVVGVLFGAAGLRLRAAVGRPPQPGPDPQPTRPPTPAGLEDVS